MRRGAGAEAQHSAKRHEPLHSQAETLSRPFCLNPFLQPPSAPFQHHFISGDHPVLVLTLQTQPPLPGILTSPIMAQREQQRPAASAAVQQSDNIAHALAGAGGGILSMVLTYACPASVPMGKPC